MTTSTRTRSAAADAACRDAVDLARAAAEEEAGRDEVGDHLGISVDGERVVTHYFANGNGAYRGWRWAVSVMRAARGRTVTVAEVVLLPGEEALLAPAWVPWSDRLRPGDLGVGDLLPTPVDDERLTPMLFSSEDPAEEGVAFEVGLGRARVLSFEGRTEAVERWYAGDHGPEAPIARAAPSDCATCGFFVPLSGALRQAFGVCANAFAADDGRVVSVDHGCGAHSEAVSMPATHDREQPLVDDFAYDVVPVVVPEHSHGSVSDADGSEPLGHS